MGLDTIDNFVQSDQSNGSPTFAGLGESLGGLFGSFASLAGQGVTVYDSLTGKPSSSVTTTASTSKPAPGLFDNFPLAGKKTLNMVLVFGGGSLVLGLALWAMKRK